MLLYINIIQIFLGIFLDMAAHILITTPLFLPLAIQMGVGPVQFGMMLLLNCALGLVHPPVGTVQFVGCAIGEHLDRRGDARPRGRTTWRSGSRSTSSPTSPCSRPGCRR